MIKENISKHRMFHFLQADLKKRDMINGNKEDISLDWSMKQITTPSENEANGITPIIGNSRSIDSYKHQLEEKDKIIAMLRQAIEVRFCYLYYYILL